ncbi:MAG TPA: neutral zinc metallopeptidase [Smithellaceae bacterium]|nr:neutral zinc metallopeptidase [Smithellaceae bacterium]
MSRKKHGYDVSDSFTHGSSAQRVSWFKRGFEQEKMRFFYTK